MRLKKTSNFACCKKHCLCLSNQETMAPSISLLLLQPSRNLENPLLFLIASPLSFSPTQGISPHHFSAVKMLQHFGYCQNCPRYARCRFIEQNFVSSLTPTFPMDTACHALSISIHDQQSYVSSVLFILGELLRFGGRHIVQTPVCSVFS